MGMEVSSEEKVRKRASLPSEGPEDLQMSSEGTMGRIHRRRGVAGRNVGSSPSEKDPGQRGLGRGGGRHSGERRAGAQHHCQAGLGGSLGDS